MGTITIRKLPDSLIERLKERAQQSGRSMEAEVRHMLEIAARRPDTFTQAEIARRRAAIDRVRDLRGVLHPHDGEMASSLIDEGHDR